MLLLLLFLLLQNTSIHKCYDNLIIGAATNYNVEALFSFVKSFKYSGTKLNSKLLLLLHDWDLLYFLKRYNIDNNRFKWIRKYLRESSYRYCNVLLTDVRGIAML